jgi:hypothetical protein
VLLSDFESTRKNADTGEYLDLCCKCHSYTKQPTIDNFNLLDAADEANLDMNMDDDEFTWMVDIEE